MNKILYIVEDPNEHFEPIPLKPFRTSADAAWDDCEIDLVKGTARATYRINQLVEWVRPLAVKELQERGHRLVIFSGKDSDEPT